MDKPVSPPKPRNIAKKALFDFGLFGIFFFFYLGAALIQTPLGVSVATKPMLGMPFGLAVSLAIFPVSWLLLIIWFWKGK